MLKNTLDRSLDVYQPPTQEMGTGFRDGEWSKCSWDWR